MELEKATHLSVSQFLDLRQNFGLQFGNLLGDPGGFLLRLQQTAPAVVVLIGRRGRQFQIPAENEMFMPAVGHVTEILCSDWRVFFT